jgi:hypothetical protein
MSTRPCVTRSSARGNDAGITVERLPLIRVLAKTEEVACADHVSIPA